MEPITPLGRERRRAAREQAFRVKQFVAISTTAGYGLVGGAFFEPVLKAKALIFSNILLGAAGLALLALAIYLAPKGEVDVSK